MKKDAANEAWSKQKCENRFVTGDRITLKDLANASKQPLGTLRRWCNEESWTSKRDQYEFQLRSATQEKTAEKTSEKLSEELSDVATINYKVHRLERDYIAAIFQIKSRHMQLVQQVPLEEQLELLEKYHNPHEINQLSLALGRATEGIAQATGLSYYLSGNAAAKRIEDMGGDIVFTKEDRDST